ncbi:GNAT family N-acetyltransferase [Parachitinimonas caeni]|uniref:GNAT family N-acetyltransferase n=1 Tax=Parachitinimonas caeni TaxID=3031301 RepID=A0ABT7E5C8_9NEIS|nr:GNAT family N-acetyltransferase [Parachitinimonas caeni]MDK2126117.1 GNAT family N-acetyltransferase [Parachitinimonas caeni]
MSIDFRLANQTDLPAIVAIYNSTIASRMVTADLTPVSVESRQAWFDAHQPQRHPLWVMLEHGKIIGWLSLSAFYGRPAYDATVEISVYLAESVRGRGLGQLAIDYAVAASPALGIRTLLGFIFAHNQPSMRLFTRCGFAQWGLLPDVAELDGQERSLVILGRRLQLS